MNLHQREDSLTECDREPIHHIAAIQPFGGLIAAHADGTLAHASANLAAMLGLAAQPGPGTPLADIIAPGALALLEQALGSLVGIDLPERRFGLDLAGTATLFDCAVHRSGALSIIEFEPHARNDFADHVAMIVPVIAKLEALSDPQDLCETAARLVRQMLGYDRVMIYRFHPDDSGEVVAEERADDMEPFLGLRYPAADIPQQARELFRRNRFRVIADMIPTPCRSSPRPARTTPRLTCRCRCCGRTPRCTSLTCATWGWAHRWPLPSCGMTGCGG